jgi:hypothetical protein
VVGALRFIGFDRKLDPAKFSAAAVLRDFADRLTPPPLQEIQCPTTLTLPLSAPSESLQRALLDDVRPDFDRGVVSALLQRPFA